jgi:uncharacterized protein YraI
LVPAATTEAADAQWFAQYYNNVNLSGTPVHERFENEINYDWGERKPAAPGVNLDQFSVRWTRSINFPTTGTYRFSATMDDGMRVYVDNALVVNAWTTGSVRTVTGDVYLNAGDHGVRVEFFDQLLNATAKLSWQFVNNAPPPPVNPPINNWRGEYFNNIDLLGNPVLVRDDAAINFNWGTGSPAGNVNADYFSARWTRSLNLGTGRYRFVTTTDDGVRLWINGQLVIDQWKQQTLTSYSAEVDLAGSTVNVRMEYFELDRTAEAYLNWQQVSSTPPQPPPPTPTPGVGTATVASARANVRHGPSTTFAIMTTLTQGTVQQLGGYRTADNYWVQVILTDGSRGWTYAPLWRLSVPISSLTVWTQGGFPQGPWATMTGAYHLNVRRGPGVQHASFTTINRNTVVELHGRNAAGTWVQIRLRDGRFGWVNVSYLTTSTPISSLPVTG